MGSEHGSFIISQTNMIAEKIRQSQSPNPQRIYNGIKPKTTTDLITQYTEPDTDLNTNSRAVEKFGEDAPYVVDMLRSIIGKVLEKGLPLPIDEKTGINLLLEHMRENPGIDPQGLVDTQTGD